MALQRLPASGQDELQRGVVFPKGGYSRRDKETGRESSRPVFCIFEMVRRARGALSATFGANCRGGHTSPHTG